MVAPTTVRAFASMLCVTRVMSCSVRGVTLLSVREEGARAPMIGPSSRSAVAKCAVAPMALTPLSKAW
jgi:hypothetical protein